MRLIGYSKNNDITAIYESKNMFRKDGSFQSRFMKVIHDLKGDGDYIIFQPTDEDIRVSISDKDKEEFTVCPDCGNKTVRAKGLGEGGGVECISEDCNYWFCF